MPTKRIVCVVALALALIAVVIVGCRLDLSATLNALTGFVATIQGLGALGVLLFAAAFVAWSMVLPKGPFVLLAGAIYGLGPGLAVVYLAATPVIALAFWLARRLGRARAEAWLARKPWLAACDRALERHGGRVIVLMRMSPIIPSQLQNYLYGLSRVRFRTCILASWLGMLPFTAVWVGVGAAVGAHGGGVEERLAWTLPIGIALGAVALTLVAWQARRALRAAGVVAVGEAPALALDEAA